MAGLQSLFGSEADIVRERNYQILWLAGVIPPLGTAMISPVLDSLIAPLGASAANIGLMMSAFTAPAIVLVPFIGAIADRYGRKPVLVASLLLAGGAGIAIAATSEFRVALALRFVQGIGFAGISPIITTSLGDLYSGAKEGTGQGIRVMGGNLAGAVLPMIAGLVVVLAWQYPFLLYGITIPIAVGVALWFDEPSRSADPSQSAGGARPYVRELLGLIRTRLVFGLLAAQSFSVAIWIGFLTYNSLIVIQLMDGTPFEAGVLKALASVASGLVATQVGRLTGGFDTRITPLVGANVCLAVGLATFVYAPSVAVAALSIVLTGVGFGVEISMYRSYLNEVAPERLRGGLVSVATSGSQLVFTVTPIAMGAIIAATTPTLGPDGALRLAGLAVAAVGAGGAILFLLLVRTAPDLTNARPGSADA